MKAISFKRLFEAVDNGNVYPCLVGDKNGGNVQNKAYVMSVLFEDELFNEQYMDRSYSVESLSDIENDSLEVWFQEADNAKEDIAIYEQAMKTGNLFRAEFNDGENYMSPLLYVDDCIEEIKTYPSNLHVIMDGKDSIEVSSDLYDNNTEDELADIFQERFPLSDYEAHKIANAMIAKWSR